MKLLLLILANAGWCCCQLFEQSGNAVDITGATVKQVESLIAKDPKLPRLTRGEIISLINEVRNLSTTRGDKSLMVVLPYNGTGSELEELYTKPPVIKFEGEPTTTARPKRRRKKPTTTARPVYVHSTEGPSTASAPWKPTISTLPPLPITQSTVFAPKKQQTPYREDLNLPQPMRETLVEISVSPDAEIPVFVTPHAMPKPTAPPVPSDVKNTAEALTPDIKQVLNSIGIFGEATTEKPVFQLKAMSPSIDPTTYSRFKPLPSGTDVSDDMKSFLKSFGLLEPSNRQQKAMREPPKGEDPLINEYILTDDMKQVLKDIGLMDKKAKKMHVFNPQEESSKLNQTEHMIKINKILKKLREISEGSTENISQEELKELLALEGGEDSNKTLLDSELDPAILKADEYQSLDSIKNEVKRQQPNVSTEASTEGSGSGAPETSEGSGAGPTESASASASADDSSSASVSASSGETTVEESAPVTTELSAEDSVSQASEATDPSVSAASEATERTPSLDDLADSFGGDVSTPRPNGFYFLLDWNSFLDVGLDERKISLNFSPKVGDPKNFLPVSIR